MIPDPLTVDNEEQVPNSPETSQSAYELHKTLLQIYLSRGLVNESVTAEELNKMLIQYAYRGRDIRYKNSHNEMR